MPLHDAQSTPGMGRQKATTLPGVEVGVGVSHRNGWIVIHASTKQLAARTNQQIPVTLAPLRSKRQKLPHLGGRDASRLVERYCGAPNQAAVTASHASNCIHTLFLTRTSMPHSLLSGPNTQRNKTHQRTISGLCSNLGVQIAA